MFYWLIPYLVAYNASDTGNWEYGPEHLFKAKVRSDMVIENATYRFDINMFIACRPINSSFVQYYIESATLDGHALTMSSGRDSGDSKKYEIHEELGELDKINFQVEFDKMGPSYVTFPKTIREDYRQNMIRVIIGEFGIGTDLSNVKPDVENIFEEKTINGICETSFDIKKEKLSLEKEEPAAIEGLKFDLPSFPERLGDESIIIEKKRKINNCSVKRNYFLFRNTEKDGSHSLKHNNKVENNIIRSKTIIYLGKNRFSSYTENEGTVEVKTFELLSKMSGKKPDTSKISEKIDLKLVAIRPAKGALFKL